MRQWIFGLLVVGLCLGQAAGVSAAVVYSEQFTDDAAGWTDDGAMTVAHDAGGFLAGTFTSAGPAVPQSGRFVADGSASAGNFTGDLLTPTAGSPTFSFLFTALDALPANLQLEVVGSSTLSLSLNPNLLTVGAGSVYTVNLLTASWLGSPSPSVINDTLVNVSSVELLVDTSPFVGTQTFGLDNFTLSDSASASAIPEPHSMGLMLGALLGVRVVSRNMRAWGQQVLVPVPTRSVRRRVRVRVRRRLSAPVMMGR